MARFAGRWYVPGPMNLLPPHESAADPRGLPPLPPTRFKQWPWYALQFATVAAILIVAEYSAGLLQGKNGPWWLIIAALGAWLITALAKLSSRLFRVVFRPRENKLTPPETLLAQRGAASRAGLALSKPTLGAGELPPLLSRPRQWPWYAMQVGIFFGVCLFVVWLGDGDRKDNERGFFLGALAAFGITFLIVVIQNLLARRRARRVVLNRNPMHASQPSGQHARLIRSGRPGSDSAQ